MTRLNNGATSLDEKRGRRERLIELKHAEVIQHENADHLVIASVRLSEIRDRWKRDSVFTTLMSKILRFAGLIESIVSSPIPILPEKSLRPRQGFRSQMSSADKERIRVAAEEFAQSHYRERDFDVRDVSGRRGLGYDFQATRRGECLYIEVKGTTCNPWTVTISRNEFNAATQLAADFRLMVVIFDNVDDLKVVHHEIFEDPTQCDLEILPESYSVCQSHATHVS